MSGRLLERTNEITSTGLAILRRDGFASMSGTGELTTVGIRFTGENFFVNAKVNGELRVESLMLTAMLLVVSLNPNVRWLRETIARQR